MSRRSCQISDAYFITFINPLSLPSLRLLHAHCFQFFWVAWVPFSPFDPTGPLGPTLPGTPGPRSPLAPSLPCIPGTPGTPGTPALQHVEQCKDDGDWVLPLRIILKRERILICRLRKARSLISMWKGKRDTL